MRALFSVTPSFLSCTAMCLFCTLCFSQVIAGNTTDKHWSEKSPFTSSTTTTAKPSKSKRAKKKVAPSPAVIEHTIKQTKTYPNVPIPTTNLGLRRPRFERLNDPTDHMQEAPTDDAYTIGNAKINATYARTQANSPENFDKMLDPSAKYDPTQDDHIQSRNDGGKLHLGMEYGVEKGHVDLSVDYARYKNGKNTTTAPDNNATPDVKSFSLGYTYDVSNNTSFYSAVTHTKYEKEGFSTNENSDDDVTGIRFGVNHKF